MTATTGPPGLAVVTGASSGIGEAIARLLAREKRPLLLVARSGDALEKLARELAEQGSEAAVLAVDLGTPEGRDAVFARTEGAGSPVSLLVNNAGFGLVGPQAEVPVEKLRALLELKVVTTAELTHRFLVAMRTRGRGAILNVSSTSAFYPTPYFSAYGASNAFVLNFSHALHEEAKADGVVVTCLVPGYTKTNFHAVARMKGAETTPFPEMTAEAVAKVGLAAVRKGKAFAVTHPLDRLWIASGRLVPRAVPARIGARFFRKAKLDG